MRGQKKHSPFMRLKRAIDNELFDTALAIQDAFGAGLEMRDEYILGYRTALEYMSFRAEQIYNGTASHTMMDRSVEETIEALRETLKEAH